MNTELLLMRGLIASMDKADQEKVSVIAEQLRTITKDSGKHGLLALALVALETQEDGV